MESTPVKPFTSLALDRLRLLVHIGNEAEERKKAQYVSFDIHLRFASVPEACFSDLLEDTICYGAISEKILKICNLREYRLLEKLGWDVYSALRESLPKTIQLSVQATKEKTPIKALQDGAKFSITDGYTQSDVENP